MKLCSTGGRMALKLSVATASTVQSVPFTRFLPQFGIMGYGSGKTRRLAFLTVVTDLHNFPVGQATVLRVSVHPVLGVVYERTGGCL